MTSSTIRDLISVATFFLIVLKGDMSGVEDAAAVVDGLLDARRGSKHLIKQALMLSWDT